MSAQVAHQSTPKNGQFQPTANKPSGLLQRKCGSCGNHTIAGSDCSECSKGKRFNLQTKLTVNEPGDIYEQEADRIADQVLAAPVRPDVGHIPRRIQRFTGQSAGQTEAVPASVDRVLASPGSPLDPALRQDMEQRFGYDFSGVRVHFGRAAEQSARGLNANAYTVGSNITFAAGQFAPATHKGRQLIAHELVHVVQQAPMGGLEGQNDRASCAKSPSSPRSMIFRQMMSNPRWQHEIDRLTPTELESEVYRMRDELESEESSIQAEEMRARLIVFERALMQHDSQTAIAERRRQQERTRRFRSLRRRAPAEFRRLRETLTSRERRIVVAYIRRRRQLETETLSDRERSDLLNNLDYLIRSTLTAPVHEIITWEEISALGPQEAERRAIERERSIYMYRRYGSVDIDRAAHMRERLAGLDAIRGGIFGAVGAGIGLAVQSSQGGRFDPEDHTAGDFARAFGILDNLADAPLMGRIARGGGGQSGTHGTSLDPPAIERRLESPYRPPVPRDDIGLAPIDYHLEGGGGSGYTSLPEASRPISSPMSLPPMGGERMGPEAASTTGLLGSGGSAREGSVSGTPRGGVPDRTEPLRTRASTREMASVPGTGTGRSRQTSARGRARVSEGGARGPRTSLPRVPVAPVMIDGNLRRGWIHIQARHITGTHPNGPGDLFAPGTTRQELERAARIILRHGVRISEPLNERQIFEINRVTIHGLIDRVRVGFHRSDGSIFTMYPVRSEGREGYVE